MGTKEWWFWAVAIVVAAIAGLVLKGWMFGDWRCALMSCVLVK